MIKGIQHGPLLSQRTLFSFIHVKVKDENESGDEGLEYGSGSGSDIEGSREEDGSNQDSYNDDLEANYQTELELYRAVQENDTDKALKLLSQHEGEISCNTIDPDHSLQWSMLHWASFHGNEWLVVALLSCNAASRYKTHKMKNEFLTATSEDRAACLHVEVLSQKKHVAMPNRLPEVKECINENLSGGNTAGFGARIVKRLDPVRINTPLHRAAQRGHLQVSQILLLSGYDIEDVDSLGNTPLHLSAAAGRVDTLKCFLEAGSDIHSRNRYNHTPLDVAAGECRGILEAALKMNPTPLSKQERYKMFRSHSEEFLNAEKAIHSALSMGQECNVQQLQLDLKEGAKIGITSETLQIGNDLVEWMSVKDKLVQATEKVDLANPIHTLSKYDLVLELEKAIAKAEETMKSQIKSQEDINAFNSGKSQFQQLDDKQFDLAPLVQVAKDGCRRSHANYWLHHEIEATNMCFLKYENVCLEKEISRQGKLLERLETQMEIAQKDGCDMEFLKRAKSLKCKRSNEVNLVRLCLREWPLVTLPPPDQAPTEDDTPPEPLPVDYWKPEDIGQIDESPGHPILEEGTEYKWIPSYACQCLESAVYGARDAIEKAKVAQCDEILLQKCRTVLDEKEANLAELIKKDAVDKKASFEVAAANAIKILTKKKKKSKSQSNPPKKM